VRIEARGDDDQLRAERIERWQDPVLEGFAQFGATIARGKRRVEDVAHPGFADCPGAGEERHLMR
jgi:hypothetical protein